jgi:hypothetical protein
LGRKSAGLFPGDPAAPALGSVTRQSFVEEEMTRVYSR